MMKFYECLTCKQLNGIWRLHCQTCGSVPLAYRIEGVNYNIVPAFGSEPAKSRIGERVHFRTVELDYYAGA